MKQLILYHHKQVLSHFNFQYFYKNDFAYLQKDYHRDKIELQVLKLKKEQLQTKLRLYSVAMSTNTVQREDAMTTVDKPVITTMRPRGPRNTLQLASKGNC